jgi:hypothetical protein
MREASRASVPIRPLLGFGIPTLEWNVREVWANRTFSVRRGYL